MRAIESQQNTPSALDRALRCRQKLLARLQLLKSYPFAYGTLSVRTLLDTIEQTLREYDFPDPYLAQKQLENNVAISEFEARIQYVDTLEDPSIELIQGLLAGNFFDWGAKEVSQILEGPDNFGFADARNKLQPRPWLIDGVDAWKDRIQNGPPHKCVTIFVDNSGYDFVLGALPLVRWFLQRGTEVIIAANTSPALNDMTFAEMLPVLEQISEKCAIIRTSLQNHKLLLISNGQSSPCLDLSRVNQQLNQLVQRKQVDLVIIEGMGRAIHTNLNANFSCEVIKLAVIKNAWLGKRLGGDVFSVVFKYEV
jgi:type II pantothenate kinase